VRDALRHAIVVFVGSLDEIWTAFTREAPLPRTGTRRAAVPIAPHARATAIAAAVVAGSLAGVPAAHAGETLYVDGRCAKAGDGRAASCAATPGAVGAWNSPESVQCSAAHTLGKVNPGDTLQVRAGTYGGRWFAIARAECSGTAAEPVTIENYPGDHVIFDGTADIKGNTWTSRGSGVWECTAGASCAAGVGRVTWRAWYAIGRHAEQALKLVDQSAATCASVAPGQLEIVESTGNLCVNIDGTTSPAATDYFRVPVASAWLDLAASGVEHQIYRRNPKGGSFSIRRYQDSGITLTPSANKGMVFDGLAVSYVYDRCLNMTCTGQARAGTVVENMDVSYCGQEGIRVDGDIGGPRILRNTIRDTQSAAVFDDCRDDTHGCRKSQDNGTGIRLVRSSRGGLVSGNVVSYSGPTMRRHRSIDLEGGGDWIVVKANTVRGAHASGGAAEVAASAAIRLSAATIGAECANGVAIHGTRWTATVIRHNVLEDVDQCILLDGGTGTMTNVVDDVLSITRNTCAAGTFVTTGNRFGGPGVLDVSGWRAPGTTTTTMTQSLAAPRLLDVTVVP
jgi:hypothetical protein